MPSDYGDDIPESPIAIGSTILFNKMSMNGGPYVDEGEIIWYCSNSKSFRVECGGSKYWRDLGEVKKKKGEDYEL